MKGPHPPRPRALTIAGSDSGGGAGIQADLKTFSVLGVYGMTAITAVTVQNTKGVSSFEEISPTTVADQIRAVAGDIGVDAAKTGMLASAGIVEAVAEAVGETRLPNLVVDPVFVSKHGHPLLSDDAVGVLIRLILPLATLVTPNLSEAGGLAGFDVHTREDMRRAAGAILNLGPRAVLVKGVTSRGTARPISSPTEPSRSGSTPSVSRRRTRMGRDAPCPRPSRLISLEEPPCSMPSGRGKPSSPRRSATRFHSARGSARSTSSGRRGRPLAVDATSAQSAIQAKLFGATSRQPMAHDVAFA